MNVSGKYYDGSIPCIIKIVTLITGLIVPTQFAQTQPIFPIASPRQVAFAVKDCVKSGGRPKELEKMNWHPEQMPPSQSGKTKYVSQTNPAWMPVPDRLGGEEVCWVIARATDARSNYERSISGIVGTKANIGAKDSEWLTTSHVFVMDWFSDQGITDPMTAGASAARI